jgi:hypothetical protein
MGRVRMIVVWEDVRKICWSRLNHEELQQGRRGEVGRFKLKCERFHKSW